MISRKGYYSNQAILFEMVKQQMGGRETAFISYLEKEGKKVATAPIRWLMASYLDMLKRHWERYEFLEKPMNIYFSLTKYNLPTFSYNTRIKSAEQQIWMDEFRNRVVETDCFIETDSSDLKLSMTDCREIRDFLMKYSIKFSTKFSGSKGGHVIIPGEEFDFDGLKPFDDKLEQSVTDYTKFMLDLPCKLPEIGQVMDKVMLYKTIGLRMKTILALDTIDTGVQDVKRVCKTPYSWDVKSNHIAYPLNDVQLDNFDNELYTPEMVLRYNNFKRGMLFRNENTPKETRKLGLARMLSDLGIVKLK
jgi:hypothetical protein